MPRSAVLRDGTPQRGAEEMLGYARSRKKRIPAQPRNRDPLVVLRLGVASLLGELVCTSSTVYLPRGAGGKASTWVVPCFATARKRRTSAQHPKGMPNSPLSFACGHMMYAEVMRGYARAQLFIDALKTGHEKGGLLPNQETGVRRFLRFETRA